MNYNRIGDYIELVDERNTDLKVDVLLGLSISKQFIPSVANTIGTNMKNYKIIRKNQFACSVMQVRRDGKMPVALLKEYEEAIISQAYPVFQVIDEEELLPDYLMMWFTRTEFDRQATFHAVGGVRGSLEWEDFLDFELPIPPIEKQQQIVAEYNTVTNRIELNEKINTNLEATAQALYKHWFVDFEFPNEEGKPYKSSGGKLVYNEELDNEIPEGWSVERFENIFSKITDGKHGNCLDEFNSGYYFISAKDILKYSIDYNNARQITKDDFNETHKRTDLREGDILITNSGTIGKTHLVKSNCFTSKTTFQKSVAILKPYDNSICSFLFSMINFEIENLKELAGGSNQSNLLLGDLRNFKILFPAQNLIKQFEYQARLLICKIENNENQSQKLKELQCLQLAKMTRV